MSDKAITEFEQFDSLYHSAVEGTASDAELQQLNDLLRDNPSVRDYAARFLVDESFLREYLQASTAAERFRTHSGDNEPGNSADQFVRGHFLNRQSPVRRMHRTYAWIAVMALLLNIGGWWFWTQNSAPSEVTVSEPRSYGQPPQESPERDVVGTVTLNRDCVWVPAMNLGDHIRIGQLRLQSGTGRIHLTNGVELVVSESSELHFVSADHVRIERGQVIASVNEAAIGFHLETPTTKIVDVGTEFAVSVDESGQSRVHVLDGAVSCLPAAGITEATRPLLVKDSSSEFKSADDAMGTPIASRVAELRKFQRATLGRTAEMNTANLLAWEDFDYTAERPIRSKLNGVGWATPWLRRYTDVEPAMVVVRSGQNLKPPAWLASGINRYCVLPTGSVSHRQLDVPVDLSVDTEYFVSVVMKKRLIGLPANKMSGAGFSLRSAEDKDRGVGFSLDWRNVLTSWMGPDHWTGGAKVEPDTTYFVVMKIIAHPSQADQVKIRLRTDGDAIEVVEPNEWDNVAQPVALDGQLDNLVIWCGGNAVTLMDQIRIGTSWQSVVPVRLHTASQLSNTSTDEN